MGWLPVAKKRTTGSTRRNSRRRNTLNPDSACRAPRPYVRWLTVSEESDAVDAGFVGLDYICPLLSPDDIFNGKLRKAGCSRMQPDAIDSAFRYSFLVIWTRSSWVPGKVPR